MALTDIWKECEAHPVPSRSLVLTAQRDGTDFASAIGFHGGMCRYSAVIVQPGVEGCDTRYAMREIAFLEPNNISFVYESGLVHPEDLHRLHSAKHTDAFVTKHIAPQDKTIIREWMFKGPYAAMSAYEAGSDTLQDQKALAGSSLQKSLSQTKLALVKEIAQEAQEILPWLDGNMVATMRDRGDAFQKTAFAASEVAFIKNVWSHQYASLCGLAHDHAKLRRSDKRFGYQG